MLWLEVLCPALLAPIAVNSPRHLQGKITAWNVPAIQIGQISQRFDGTSVTAYGAGGQSVVRTGILSTAHLHTACLDKVLDSETLTVQVVPQNSTLVRIAKDTIQASGAKIQV